MPRKKETTGVERHFLYELFAMNTDVLKEHLFAVNDAALYHRDKLADVDRYKYRVERILKVKQWLDAEEQAINE